MDYKEMVENLQKMIREAPLSMVPALFIVLTEEVVARKAFQDDGLVNVLKRIIKKQKAIDIALGQKDKTNG